MGPLIFLFWTSGDICPGLQSQGGFPRLPASSPAHNGFLRFTSGATPVDCIEVSTAAEPFKSTYLQTCPKALVEVRGSNPRGVGAFCGRQEVYSPNLKHDFKVFDCLLTTHIRKPWIFSEVCDITAFLVARDTCIPEGEGSAIVQ